MRSKNSIFVRIELPRRGILLDPKKKYIPALRFFLGPPTPFAARRQRELVEVLDRIEDPQTRDEAAEQLIGLADVAYVDAESSWLLTDELGTPNSCFLGAVRLYWPSQRSDGSYEGVTWIAARLAPFGQGDAGRVRTDHRRDAGDVAEGDANAQGHGADQK